MKTIYLLRHGENLSNQKKIFSCRKIDYELTEFGRQQIRQQVKYFIDKNIALIFSSPSVRALQSAEILSNNKIRIEVSDLLLEVDVGDLEGKSETEITYWNQYRNMIKKWEAGNVSHQLPNSESLMDVKRRLDRFIKIFDESGLDNVLIVSHGLLLMCFFWLYCINKKSELEANYMKRGHLSKLQYIGAKYEILKFNYFYK